MRAAGVAELELPFDDEPFDDESLEEPFDEPCDDESPDEPFDEVELSVEGDDEPFAGADERLSVR